MRRAGRVINGDRGGGQVVASALLPIVCTSVSCRFLALPCPRWGAWPSVGAVGNEASSKLRPACTVPGTTRMPVRLHQLADAYDATCVRVRVRVIGAVCMCVNVCEECVPVCLRVRARVGGRWGPPISLTPYGKLISS